MIERTESWREIRDKWKNGEAVWTVELGGIGPGYEQAIQELLFEILCRWPENKPLEPNGEKYPQEYDDLVDEVTSELNKVHGFSGAQVGAAKSTAFQFIHRGYASMMNKLDEERHILVQKAKWY